MRINKSGHPNTDKRHKAARRSLLIGTTALPFVPTTWTAPVVQSVLLPAHAQTSPDGDSVAACSLTDIIPGQEFACADEEFCVAYSYTLEEGCLIRNPVDCNGPSENVVIIRASYEEGEGNRQELTICLSGDPLVGSTSCQFQYCDDDPSDNDQFPVEVQLTIDGVPYNASGTLGRTEVPPSVFISDITVAPA